MQKQIIFKRNEINKLAQNPKFISSIDTDKLLKSKISTLESKRRYEEKRKRNGGKALRENVIEKLKRENKMLKNVLYLTSFNTGFLFYLIYLLIK